MVMHAPMMSTVPCHCSHAVSCTATLQRQSRHIRSLGVQICKPGEEGGGGGVGFIQKTVMYAKLLEWSGLQDPIKNHSVARFA